MAKQETTGATKEKKPIYKRVWFWIIVVLVLAGIGASMGSSKASSTKTSASTSQESTKKDDSKKDDSQPAEKKEEKKDGLSKENFDKINISESDGTSKEDVEAMFGKKPDSTSTSTVMDVQSDMLTWNGGLFGSSITVGFNNNHAFTKSMNGLKGTKKVTLADFDQVNNGMNEDDVKAKLGDPTGIDITKIMDTTTTVLTFNGKELGSSAVITLTNGAVSGKTQMSLK